MKKNLFFVLSLGNLHNMKLPLAYRLAMTFMKVAANLFPVLFLVAAGFSLRNFSVLSIQNLYAGEYRITTVAGNSVEGYSGDNGSAISAALKWPSGIAVDSFGNLYIADSSNNRIRKVSSSGIITTVAGTGSPGYSGDNGSATSAQLYFPYGIAVDSSGNLYIADTSNHRIRKVSSNSGIITTVAGNGASGYSGDNGSATSAQLYFPYGIAVDSSGNLFIADNWNHRIRKVSGSGIITTVAGNGTQGYSGDNGSATSAALFRPSGIAVDSSGNLFIADNWNHRIRKVSGSGIITTVAGNGTLGYSGDNGNATTAQLNYPCGIAVDSSGNLYIADKDNNRIRKVYWYEDPGTTGTTGGSSGGKIELSRVFITVGVTPLRISVPSTNAERRVNIYNALGDLVVKDLAEMDGQNTLIWRGKDQQQNNVTPGIYYITYQENGEAKDKKKVMVVR